MVSLALFYAVLMYASVIDIKTRMVPNRIYIALILIGLISVNVSSLVGLLLTGAPLLLCALILPESIGGGDIKFGALCGFILKSTNGLAALFVGLLICLIAVPIIGKARHKPTRETSIPLIPYISIGCIIVSFIV